MGRDNRGGTLVELLAVVVILGLLVSPVAVVWREIVPRARRQCWVASIRALQGASEMYYARWGRYPVAGEQPSPSGVVASPLDLAAPGGDGRPFSSGLRSRPPGDAAAAGLRLTPAPLYYGVHYLGRVFATVEPPPWTGDTVVFLPEFPGGIPLGRVARGGGGGGSAGPGEDAGMAPVVLEPAGPPAVLMSGVEVREGGWAPVRGPALVADCELPVPLAGAGVAVLESGLYLLGGQGNPDGILHRPSPEGGGSASPPGCPTA